MNIAFIGALTGVGGIQKVSALIASELARYNIVCYIDYRGDDEFRFPLSNDVKIYNVASSKNKGRRMIEGDKIRSMYQQEINSIVDILSQNKIDLAFFAGSFCTALIAEIKDKLLKIKMIAWQHNSFEQYMGRYSEKYLDEYLKGLACADSVICLTEHDALLFSKYNCRSVCIGNPININHSEQCNLESKKFLAVGRIEIEHKGLDLLLDAFDLADVPEWTLSIIGNGNDMQTLAEKVTGLNKCDKVLLKGQLFDNELLQEYKNSSIFIITSRWEGFPLTILEAMSFGLPIVSTPITCSKEVLRDGEYGLLSKSFSVEDIAEAIRTMTGSLELRQHYSVQSMKRVQDYTVEKIIPMWNELLVELYQ